MLASMFGMGFGHTVKQMLDPGTGHLGYRNVIVSIWIIRLSYIKEN